LRKSRLTFLRTPIVRMMIRSTAALLALLLLAAQLANVSCVELPVGPAAGADSGASLPATTENRLCPAGPVQGSAWISQAIPHQWSIDSAPKLPPPLDSSLAGRRALDWASVGVHPAFRFPEFGRAPPLRILELSDERFPKNYMQKMEKHYARQTEMEMDSNRVRAAGLHSRNHPTAEVEGRAVGQFEKEHTAGARSEGRQPDCDANPGAGRLQG
jgi:hypothetical protein